MPRNALPLVLLLAAAGSCAAAPASAPASKTDASEAQSRPPLTSSDRLQAYLREQPSGSTPFDALAPGARTRFIEGIGFGERGIVGLDVQDLHLLTAGQARALLALLGAESLAGTLAIDWSPTPSPPATAAPSELELRYNAYNRVRRARQPATAARRPFAQWFPEIHEPAELPRLADADLALLARAIRIEYAEAGEDASLLPALAAAMALLQQRGTAHVHDLRQTADTLLLARDYAGAQRLARALPGPPLLARIRFLDPLPPEAAAPSVWRMDDAGTTLVRETVDLQPLQIVVAAGCHFSADAARDIAADPLLGPVFARHARWLSLPPGAEDLQAVREWNLRQPQAPMLPIHARQPWSLLGEWRMPTFHVVRQGRIVASSSGWRSGDAGDRQRLVELLRENGLLADQR